MAKKSKKPQDDVQSDETEEQRLAREAREAALTAEVKRVQEVRVKILETINRCCDSETEKVLQLVQAYDIMTRIG